MKLPSKNPTALLRCTLASLSLFAGISLSAQTAISVNLNGNSDYNLVPSDEVGVIKTANWNNLAPTSGTTDYSDILDSFGNLTEIAVQTTSSPSTYVNNTPIDDPLTLPDALMMGSSIGSSQNGHNRTVTFSSISYELYNIYVYFGGVHKDASVPYTMNLTLQGLDENESWESISPTYYLQDTNRLWSGEYVQSIATAPENAVESNYVLFENVSLTSFRILANLVGRRAGISGVQIVAVPEPSHYTMILGGVFGVFVFLRRKRK